jgi:GTPase
MANTVAIVGRPNVGKSTLFNRLIGERKAIVDDQSGITRDRQYGTFYWTDREFIVIDTGGFVEHTDDIFEKAIKDQVRIAIDEADLIMFVVDINTGITDLDQDMADILRRAKKPVLTIVNKVDNNNKGYENAEFYNLGLGDLFNISAMSGSGTGELLDEVINVLPKENDHIQVNYPKFCIVGRPNAGKSSFVNALLGYDRTIVTDIAGTTRDTIHTKYDKYGKEFLLVDTAGIRKKAKVHENIEFYSVMRAINAIEEADVVFLMIDATRGLEAQDMSIFSLAEKRKKGVVILVNKWDLVEEKQTQTTEDYKKAILEKTAPFSDIPVVFMSAMTKQRIFKAIEIGIEVYDNMLQEIPTSVLNEWLQKVTERQHPPSVKGKNINIKYATQVKSNPPAFGLFTNFPKYIREGYRRYLENEFRKAFKFSGVPVSFFFRQK